ncbi:MAG: hypothetical protein AVDCRST_MAG31-1651, partial [uncultured Sphingomonas sp.]
CRQKKTAVSVNCAPMACSTHPTNPSSTQSSTRLQVSAAPQSRFFRSSMSVANGSRPRSASPFRKPRAPSPSAPMRSAAASRRSSRTPRATRGWRRIRWSVAHPTSASMPAYRCGWPAALAWAPCACSTTSRGPRPPIRWRSWSVWRLWWLRCWSTAGRKLPPWLTRS